MIKYIPYKKILLCVVFLVCLSAWPKNSWAEFRSLVGFRHILLDEDFSHNTHPNDSFLPNAGQSGSAGVTTLKETDWIVAGARYLHETDETVFNLDLGALIGEHNEVKSKNANDNRADNIASFVYSKADMGIHSAIGYSWKKGRFILGGEAQFAVLFLESGWDRFDNQEEQDTKYKFIPTAGPKLGIYLWDENLLEFTVQGGEAFSAGANVQLKLW